MTFNKFYFKFFLSFLCCVVIFSCKTTGGSIKKGVDKSVKKHYRSIKKTPKIDFAEDLKKLLSKNKYEEALSLFDKLSPEMKNSLSIQNLKLSVMISAGKVNDASNLAVKLEKKYPKNTDILYTQAMLSDIAGNSTKKGQYFDKILKIDPNHIHALIGQGYDYFLNKNYNYAKLKFARALKANPNSSEARIALAQAEYMSGDFEKSEHHLDFVLKSEPKNSMALAERARVKFEQNKVLPAIEDMEKVVKLDPNTPSNWMDIGVYYTKAGKKKLALNAYSKAIDLDYDNYVAYIYRSGLNDDLGNIEAAIADYKKVSELYPDYFFASEGLGVLLFEKKDWEGSRLAFVNALEKSPTNVYYAMMITICYYHQNNTIKAKNFMKNYLKVINRAKNPEDYFLARLFVDVMGENDVINRIEKLKEPLKKYRMKFYLAKFYELIRQDSNIDEKLYLEISACPYPSFFEYRLVEKELKRRNIVPKAK